MRLLSLTLLPATTLLLAACGGGYSSNSTPESLVERTCVDYNANSQCESAELSDFGAKSLATSNNTLLKETVNNISGAQSFAFKAPAGSERIDALTTLLWYEQTYNPFTEGNIEQAKASLSSTFGIVWPTVGNEPSAAYVAQQQVAEQHFKNAQQNLSADAAIAATAETMFILKTLDTPADLDFVRSFNTAKTLTAQTQLDSPITYWQFQKDRAQLITLENDQNISIFGFNSEKNFYRYSSGELKAGTELRASANSNTEDDSQKSVQAQSQNIKSLGNPISLAATTSQVDAFATATTPTPAPAPAPPPPGAGGGDVNEPDSRNLNPANAIQNIQLAGDFRHGFALIRDSQVADSSARACNTSISTHGIFRFDSYISNTSYPVTGGCNQASLSDFDLASSGTHLLVADNVANRIYWVDSNTMREASVYYLQLQNDMSHMALNPSNDYFIVYEKDALQAYIVRITDMQAMSTIELGNNNPVIASQWLNNGNELLIISQNSIQVWDTRLPYSALRTEQTTHDLQGELVISENGDFIAQLFEGSLNIIRRSDLKNTVTMNNVDKVQWSGSQLLVQQDSSIKQYTLFTQVNSELQSASLELSPLFIAGENSSLNQVTQTLNLPAGLVDNSLSISWSGTLPTINYSGDQIGTVQQLSQIQQGTLSATINGFFRGQAVRWTRDFPITIQAQ